MSSAPIEHSPYFDLTSLQKNGSAFFRIVAMVILPIFAPCGDSQMARRISDPGLRFYARFGCLPAATAAEQIDRGTQFKQRIIGGLDSVHAGDGIEDDLLLFMRVVWDRTCARTIFPRLTRGRSLGQ